MGRTVGIDLGTSTSAIAVYDHGLSRVIANPRGHTVTSSSIWQDPSGVLKVGDEAKGQPEAAIEFKREMGNSQHLVSIGGQQLPPEECSSLILRHLLDYATDDLQEKPESAVITVPAKWKERPRRATEAAARLAGLKVERLINEPTAAALAFGMSTDADGQTIAVYDLGGGTFDITLLTTRHRVFDVLTSEGDERLGGTDFDRVLIDWCLLQTENETGYPATQLDRRSRDHWRLRAECERAKKDLSYSSEARIYCPIGVQNGQPLAVDVEVQRRQFDVLIEDYIAKTIDLLDHAMRGRVAKEEIDELILVGGSTRIPLVRQRVAEFLGKEPNTRDVHPDEAVARGAAIQASIVAGEVSGDDAPIVIDTNNHSLGVEIATAIDGSLVAGVFSAILPKDTKLPARRTENYTTTVDDQETVVVKCYQGDHPIAAQNELVGEDIEVSRLPPKPAGETRVEVTFDLRVDGMLDVEVHVPDAGLQRSRRFKLDRGFRADGELENRSAGLEELWQSSELAKKYKALVDRCDSVLELSPDKVSDEFRSVLENLKAAVVKGDEASAEAADLRLSDMLFDIE